MIFILFFYVYEYTVAVQMVVSLHVLLGIEFRTSARSGWPYLLHPKDIFIIINKYTVTVFRHTRRGRQILLQMVVSHHVVPGFELRTVGRAVSADSH